MQADYTKLKHLDGNLVTTKQEGGPTGGWEMVVGVGMVPRIGEKEKEGHISGADRREGYEPTQRSFCYQREDRDSWR